eukprot:COSAG02_NODE_3652_length_6414_cov_10.240222_1_plen_452_part_00
MEAPLTLQQPQAAAFEADQAAGPQQLPPQLRAKLQRWLLLPLGLAGQFARPPNGTPDMRDRLQQRTRSMMAFTMVHCAGVGILIGAAFPPEAHIAGMVAMAWMLTAVVQTAYFARVRPNIYTDILLAVLEQLDRPVNPKTAKQIERQTKGALTTYGLTAPVVLMFLIALAHEAQNAYDWIVVPLLVCTSPVITLNHYAIQLQSNVLFVLVEDRIDQLANTIRRATAGTADFDELARGVQQAHVDTTECSRRMQTTLLHQVFYGVVTVFVLVVISVAPRPERGDESWVEAWPGGAFGNLGCGHWYNFVAHPILIASIAVLTTGTTVNVLAAPARVTSACQRVAEAVNGLRLTTAEGQPTKLATPEEGHRIEILKRYIEELNKNQGMGVLVLKKRITFALVMGLMIQSVSAMIVINTTLMSILHAGQEGLAAVGVEESVIEVALEADKGGGRR